MPKYQTVLSAEDGEYLEDHETLQDALDYVERQMGYKPSVDNKDSLVNVWRDSWGRTIYIRNWRPERHEIEIW